MSKKITPVIEAKKCPKCGKALIPCCKSIHETYLKCFDCGYKERD